MKAIVLHEYGGTENLMFEDVADPVPGRDDLLVRCEATSINPLDNKLRSGLMKPMMPLQFPYVPGLEFAGVVIVVGENVHGFAPGDRVFGRARGTYAELCTVSAAEAARVPEGMESSVAAALPVVLLTGEQIVRLGAGVQAGQSILITGAVGSVGRSAVYTARKLGAHVIAGVRGRQLEEASTLGANKVISLDDEHALPDLLALDAVIDLVGGHAAEVLIGKIRPGGVFATSVPGPANAGDHPEVRVQIIQVTSDPATLESYARAILNHTLTIPIDRTIPLKEAAAGQTAVEKGGIGKVVLLP